MSRRKPTVNDDDDDDDPEELLYKTALLLGQNPKPLMKYRKSNGVSAARPKSVFVPAILRSILTPSTLKITNMHIGDKLTTFQMVPVWFQPNDREAIMKDMVCPYDTPDKHPYETIACYRAAIGRSTNFRRDPLDIGERSTETLMLSLDAFAKQFGGQLNFTNQNLSFENSAEQMACGVANMGSVHLLATDSLPTAIFKFKVGLDYKRDLARTPTTMGNFIANFSTAVARVLGCENDYVRLLSVEKAPEIGTSSVKFGLTIPDPNRTKRLADRLQTLAQSNLKKDKILRYVKPAHYDYQWQSVLSYLQLKPSDFDPSYNFDYTQSGLPKEQTRGKQPYYLPLGWYRHGLNVKDKYKDDNSIWLGASDAEGEWPVAFHGTNSAAVSSIAKTGLSIGTAKRDLMEEEAVQQLGEGAKGKGLYLATYCNDGSYPQYTHPFTVTTDKKTETFCIVFQCRVRPQSYSVHTRCVKDGEAWRVVDPNAIRPYGLLLKKEES